MDSLCFVHPIFRFWFLVTSGDEVTKIRKYYVTSMLCFDDEQELILCNTTKNFKTWHTKLDD